jgi:hypothetical protein
MNLFLATLAGLAAAGPTPDRTFTFLKDERPNIKFLPYTTEQKVAVAKNMQSLMSV